MNVLALTIFVGLLLAGSFAILWFLSACDSRQFNERDALLPLESEAEPSISRRAKS